MKKRNFTKEEKLKIIKEASEKGVNEKLRNVRIKTINPSTNTESIFGFQTQNSINITIFITCQKIQPFTHSSN